MKSYRTSCTFVIKMQLNYLKEVSKKSKNSLHTKEKKKFAFCAFGRPQGQKNAPAVYVLGKYLKQKSFFDTVAGFRL